MSFKCGKERCKMTKEQKDQWIRRVWFLILFLTVIIPLLINWSYQLPFTIITTEWEAEKVLDYYQFLLGTCVTVVTFIVTAYLTVEQIRHQQDYQQELKFLQETEEMIDQCLDAIHPMKVQIAVLETVYATEPNQAFQLISRIEKYRLDVIISADKLSSSLTRVYDDELKKLADDMAALRNKLANVTERYLEMIQREVADGITNQPGTDPKIMAARFVYFAEEKKKLTIELQGIYQNDYLALITEKSELFRSKYNTIAQRRPKLFEFWKTG